MKSIRALCLCALLAPITAVAAGSFNYNYAELGYQRQAAPGGSSLTGPDLNFSWTVYQQLQIVGGYAHLAASAPDISNNDYSAGIRGDTSFSDQTDFTTDILYLNNRTTTAGSSGTDNGVRLALGFRHLFNPLVELDGSLGHDWLDLASNDIGLGLLFNATSRWAAGLSYRHSSTRGNTASLRVRIYF